MLFPKIAMNVSARMSAGMEYSTSASRINTSSTYPPKYAETAPTTTPPVNAIPTAMIPIARAIRLP